MNLLVKYIFLLLTLSLFGLILTSCSEESKTQEKIILLVTKNSQNPFFAEMEKGALSAQKKHMPDVRLISVSGSREDDISGQRNLLERYITLHSVGGKLQLIGILLAPASSGPELTDLIRKANEKDIPVVLLDTTIAPQALEKASAKVSSLIASNNFFGGGLAAEKLWDAIEETPGTVLLLNGVHGQQTAEERRKGFLSKFKELTNQTVEKFPIIERAANWSRSEAAVAVQALISRKTKIVGIFAANDQMALGAIDTILARDNSEKIGFPIVGFDNIPEAFKAVRDGKMHATIAQQPNKMGKKGIEAIKKLRQGKAVPFNNPVEVVAILKD